MENENKSYMKEPIKLKPKVILRPQQPAQSTFQQASPATVLPLSEMPVQSVSAAQPEPQVRLATLDDLIRGGWITGITIKNEYGKMKGTAVINGNDMVLTAYGYSFDEVVRNMKEYVLSKRIEL